MKDSRHNAPVGVFDSGVGGLTVLRALRSFLPREKYIYVGDTARVPYGNKSAVTVKRYAREIGRWLESKKVKMIVAACNTVSALALKDLRTAVSVPVLGVIQPGVRAAMAATRHSRVGVIGTEATIQSRSYERALKRFDPRARVFSAACPLFVPLVEEGLTVDPVTKELARRYMRPLLRKKIDTLVLGCTHYPLLKKILKQTVGSVELIDSAEETAKAVRSRLAEDGLLADRPKGASSFYSSDDPVKFMALGRRFLDNGIQRVEKILLDMRP